METLGTPERLQRGSKDSRGNPEMHPGRPSRISGSPPVSYIEIIRFANNIACDRDETLNLVLTRFEYRLLNDVVKETTKNEK